jgi:N-acetyl sugar amidotransferase
MTRTYQICTRCIMDTTDPEIQFDADGVCNHCHQYDLEYARLGPMEARMQPLEQLVAQMREEGKGKDYDCLMGLSGGVDSSFVAWKACQLGLRPLAAHFDSGWDSEVAVRNIEKIVKTLKLDLYTSVVDWEEIRDLQLAFFRASVPNADVPQDHAYVAALYKLAVKKGIRYILSGHNLATESVLPRAWGHNSRDLRHVKAVQKRFGTMKLRKYPTISLPYSVIYCRLIKRITQVNVLNYFPYVKAEAMRIIQREFDWKDYGGKHYESVFTRFFQAYYLPTRFGFDKRRAHLSSLIPSGQITRAEALDKMKEDLYPPELLRQDKRYIVQKLGISDEEFENIMKLPLKSHRDYPSNDLLIQTLLKTRERLRRLTRRATANPSAPLAAGK